jgi:hypothetical protein
MRLSRSFAIATMVSATLIGISTPSRATDFTIVVPVDFNNLPSDVGSFVVSCSTYSPSGEVAYGATYPKVNIPVGAAAYHGDVTIPLNTAPGLDPATANRYRCSVVFGSRSDYRIAYFTTATRPPPTFPLQPGAPFVIDPGLQPLH